DTRLLTQFRQACEKEGVTYQEHLVTGVIATEMVRMTHEVDLVLIGRGGLHTSLSKVVLGSTVESVVRSSPKPTMVATQPYRDIRKPLLATDGSLSAMAALSTAIDFAVQLKLPLSVVHCASPPNRHDAFLDAIERKVASQGIACDVDICQGNAHEDLVRYACERDHDLLLMGAFGHRQIVEWLLGSTTQYLLRTSPIPLVLCHADRLYGQV
ncbi:MAG: hypothetical protein ETSY1_19485, partial [Candidatus Entotheonella factor]